MVLLYDMGQSLAHLLVHAIFSTKDRRPFLHSEEIRNEIYAYMAGTLKNLEWIRCLLRQRVQRGLGLKPPRVGRPFRAGRFISLHPGLKRPTSQSDSTELAEVLRRGWLFGVTYHKHEGRHSFSDGRPGLFC